ncbi:hypothetical protein [Polaromonas sp.]|uniref:hypothetical protein n=1 Tax=Polaromonas sp. TaxID=1869339 RepID=UPI003266BABC
MKTAVRQTSIDTYHSPVADRFSGQCNAIVAAMTPGKLYSRRQIAKALHMETSTMAARMNSLIADGRCEVCGTLKCPITGVNVEAVKLTSQQMEIA